MSEPSGNIKVLYYGLVQNVVGKREEQLDIGNGASVNDLLKSLLDKYGEGFRDSLMDTRGELRFTTRILLDGRDINDLKGLETRLGENTEASIVVMVHPIAGG